VKEKATRKRAPRYVEPHLADLKPVPLKDVELAFPAEGLRLLPKWEIIPEEFKQGGSFRNTWVRIVDEMFFGMKGGVAEQYAMEPVEGIDFEAASRHLQAALRSFQPKHEHKIAGVAYLSSLWFRLVKREA
jgi:hypothetical protein